jgi:plasmid stability protein
MPDVLIRNIDQETLDAFKSKAELNGRSLNEELRQLLERNRPYTPEERVEASRRLRARWSGDPVEPLTLDQIREGLEGME